MTWPATRSKASVSTASPRACACDLRCTPTIPVSRTRSKHAPTTWPVADSSNAGSRVPTKRRTSSSAAQLRCAPSTTTFGPTAGHGGAGTNYSARVHNYSSMNDYCPSAGVNDLFDRFLEGPEEVWDVWCRIATLHGAKVPTGNSQTPRPSIDDVIDRVSPAEAAVLSDYSAANTPSRSNSPNCARTESCSSPIASCCPIWLSTIGTASLSHRPPGQTCSSP